MLSEVIGEVSPVTGKIVGWEELKGVWNDKRYPVIWVDLPSAYPAADGLQARQFDPWQRVECSWCSTWATDPPKQPLREFVEELRQMRGALPKSLGLVDPYIVSDPDFLPKDKLPSEHEEIINLLKLVEEHQARVQKQDANEPPAGSEQPPLAASDVEQLFEEKSE